MPLIGDVAGADLTPLGDWLVRIYLTLAFVWILALGVLGVGLLDRSRWRWITVVSALSFWGMSMGFINYFEREGAPGLRKFVVGSWVIAAFGLVASVFRERDHAEVEIQRRRRLLAGTFKVGDRVVRNPATWQSNEADSWGRGVGVGVVVEPVSPLGPQEVDVRWPGRRGVEWVDQLMPAPLETSAELGDGSERGQLTTGHSTREGA
jgi:hypothetical protein